MYPLSLDILGCTIDGCVGWFGGGWLFTSHIWGGGGWWGGCGGGCTSLSFGWMSFLVAVCVIFLGGGVSRVGITVGVVGGGGGGAGWLVLVGPKLVWGLVGNGLIGWVWG